MWSSSRGPQSVDSRGGGGMRVIESRVQRIRREGRGVVLIELHQRPHQLAGARVAGRVLVGLELALARVKARERVQEEEELGQHQEEKRERRGVARRRDAQALVEPGLVDQLAQGKE